MKKSRTAISYRVLEKVILFRLRETLGTLHERGHECRSIYPKEFYDYLTGETPTGDTTTIIDVLDNDYLMIHEVVEIDELKKMGIQINNRTVMDFFSKVLEAHYAATEYEFEYALRKKDYGWLEARVRLAESWLEDDALPSHLASRCKAMIERFSAALGKQVKQRKVQPKSTRS